MAVYLIRSGEFIKIGYSEWPETRANNMQTGNPQDMKLIAIIPGNTALESQLHERFAEYRSRGEWFEEVGGLREFVIACERAFPPPHESDDDSNKRQAITKFSNEKGPPPTLDALLSMLTYWIDFALRGGLEIEQLFSPKNGRFTVRVYGVEMDGDQLIAKGGEG